MAIVSATATFVTDDSVDVTWDALGGSYGIVTGLKVTDGEGPVGVWLTAVSDGAATVNASAAFSGTVELLIYTLT